MRPIILLALILGHALLPAKGLPEAMARQVVEQVNWARQNPKAAAAVLRTWLPLFQGDHYLVFPGEPMLHTQEGAAAVSEAITFLESQTPLSPWFGPIDSENLQWISRRIRGVMGA